MTQNIPPLLVVQQMELECVRAVVISIGVFWIFELKNQINYEQSNEVNVPQYR